MTCRLFFTAVSSLAAVVLAGLANAAAASATPGAPVFELQPSGGTVAPSQSFTLQALASGQGPISYQWYLGVSGDVSNPPYGATSTTYGVGSISAAQSYWVRASNSLGHVDSVTATFTLSSIPVITPLKPSFDQGSVGWMVAREVHASVAAAGATQFQVDGLPAGLVLNKFTGSITGVPKVPGTYSLRIVARNVTSISQPLLTSVVVAPLSPNVRGTFCGLIERDDNVNNSLGGKFSLTVASTGQYTGTFSLGGTVLPFKGALGSVQDDGSVRGFVGPAQGKKLQPYLEFFIDAADGRLTGSVYLMSETDMSAPVALAAVHNIWTGDVKPSVYAGNYSATLLGGPDLIPGDEAYPQGVGYITGSVSMNGLVTMSARLADNTVATTAVILGPDQSIPLHWVAYSGTGSAQGWQKLTYSADDAQGAFIDGGLTWIKHPQPARSTVRSYKAGIPLHHLVTMGSKIVVPAHGQIELGMPDRPNNAMFYVGGGGLRLGGALSLRVTTSNTAQIARGIPLAVTIDALAGKFSGTFTLEGQRAVHYGIFVPRVGRAVGFFVRPTSSSATSPILSGSVTLMEQ